MRALQKIKPILVDVIPPTNSDGTDVVQVGRTPKGLPIYQQTIVRASAAKPKLDPKTKEQVWVRHPTTGEPLYRRWTKTAESRTRFIVPNQQGNGNLSWDEWIPATKEQIALEERAKKIEAMKDGLAAALVDGGITIEQFLGQVGAAKEPVAPPKVETRVFPVHIAGASWKLSDGSMFKGKKVDAVAAEAALVKPPRADNAGMPEE